MKILLLEDDYNYNESIKEYLELLGYEIEAFYDGESALEAIMSQEYYLLLLDIKVPKINGHKLIQYIKEAGIETPIIIITSLTDINNIELGYYLGCNDYLKKPFELKELELRVKEIIKKYYHTGDDEILKIHNNLSINLKNSELIKDGQSIQLTQKEKNLVHFLLQRKNTFCTIDSIYTNVWGDKEVSFADVRVHIRKLRIKAGDDFILSSRGLGYKICVDNA